MSGHRLLTLLLALTVFLTPQTRSVVHVDSLEYPRLALLAQIQGQVRVSARINSNGIVQSAVSLSGNQILRQAAQENLLRWRFQDGAEEELEISYEFKLEKPAVLDPHSTCSFDFPNSVTVVSHVSLPDE